MRERHYSQLAPYDVTKYFGQNQNKLTSRDIVKPRFHYIDVESGKVFKIVNLMFDAKFEKENRESYGKGDPG